MTDDGLPEDPDLQRLLVSAARARALAAVARARRQLTLQSNPHSMTDKDNLMVDPTPTPEAEALAGELLAKMSLGPNGQPYGDAPDEWADADAMPEEVISLGEAQFHIVNHDARALAQELGGIDPQHPEAEALIVEFRNDETAAEAVMGRYLVLEVADGVALVFMVLYSATDRDAPNPFDLGPDAVRNPALDALGPRQALLVQVFAQDEITDESSVQP